MISIGRKAHPRSRLPGRQITGRMIVEVAEFSLVDIVRMYAARKKAIRKYGPTDSPCCASGAGPN